MFGFDEKRKHISLYLLRRSTFHVSSILFIHVNTFYLFYFHEIIF